MKNRKSKAVRSSSDFHLLARLFFRAASVPLTRMFYRDPSDPIYDMTVMGFRMLPICMPLAVVSLSFACYAQAAHKKLMSYCVCGTTACRLIPRSVSCCLSRRTRRTMSAYGLYIRSPRRWNIRTCWDAMY